MNEMPTGVFLCMFFLPAGDDSLFFSSPVPAGPICFASLNTLVDLSFVFISMIMFLGFDFSILFYPL